MGISASDDARFSLDSIEPFSLESHARKFGLDFVATVGPGCEVDVYDFGMGMRLDSIHGI